MILADQINILLQTELTSLGYDAYAWLPPQEKEYPLIVYSCPISSTITEESFTADIERTRVQISVFVNDPSPYNGIVIQKNIEKLLHRNHTLNLPDSDCGMKLICIKKIDERAPYLSEDYFWQISVDYMFICQKNPQCDPESSTSSSSGSSSSES